MQPLGTRKRHRCRAVSEGNQIFQFNLSCPIFNYIISNTEILKSPGNPPMRFLVYVV